MNIGVAEVLSKGGETEKMLSFVFRALFTQAHASIENYLVIL